jgi:hypothetical protein
MMAGEMMQSTLEQMKPELESEPAFSEAVTYRSVSRSAVISLVLSFVSLLALLFAPLLVLPVVALVLGLTALSTIRRYPGEYTGKGMALIGTAVSSTVFVLGAILHTVDYATEVPEGYQRISFSDLQPEIKIPGAPPPQKVLDLNGKQIFIKGYIHPGVATMGKVDHFILVPDMGTCCFGGQPAMTDMIEVRIKDDASKVKYSTRRVKLAGKFALGRSMEKAPGDLRDVIYHLEADIAK